jgi:large subunit ribosomal protein L30
LIKGCRKAIKPSKCPFMTGRFFSMAGKLKITMVKSMIGRPEKHRRVLRGLGLGKLNKSVLRNDTPAIRGMVQAVSHLVTAEEVTNEAQ